MLFYKVEHGYSIVQREEIESLNYHLAQCGVTIVWHSHCFTCAKNGFNASDESCRMAYPRVLLKSSYVDEITGSVFLKRQYGYLVSHNLAIMASFPMNHAVYLMCQPDRWLRDYRMWQQKVLENPDLREPKLPSLSESAADAACYNTKYITKPDNEQVNEKYLNLMDYIIKAQQSSHGPDILEDAESVRKSLQSCKSL